MTTLRTFTVTATAVAVLAACALGEAMPNEEPHAEGLIADFEPADPALGGHVKDPTTGLDSSFTFTLAGLPEDDYYYNAHMRVGSNTVIVDRDDRHVDVASLQSGLETEVWAGACQESFPVQCEVTHLRVTGAVQ